MKKRTMIVVVAVGVLLFLGSCCLIISFLLINRNKISKQNQKLNDEKEVLSSQLKELEDVEKVEEEDVDSSSECDEYHFDDYEWETFIKVSGYEIIYTEVNLSEDILCKHSIYEYSKDKLIQSPHLHRKDRKVSFFLEDINSSDFSEQFILIDLEKNEVIDSDIVVELGLSYSIIYNTDYSFDSYIIIYPVETGGCGIDDLECLENALETFKTRWAGDKIIILNTKGEKYEIPGTKLPYYTQLVFDRTSSMTLIALENTQSGYNVIKTYDLSNLF